MEEQATTMLEKTLDRRRFTLATAMAMLAGVAITITEACGGSSSSPTSSTGGSGSSSSGSGTGSSGSSDKVGSISANHGHTAVITAAQLSAGGDLTLNIQGTATHNHTVALTAAELTSIAGGTKVAHESSSDFGHSHTVTFNA